MRNWSGYRTAKRDLIRSLSGTVLEIGAGSGANFADLPADVDWIGLEPNRRARAQLARTAPRRQVLDAGAEQIPLPSASIDGVLSTVVLCSVADLPAALAELHRVLRPGGRFVFVEHVAAPRGSTTYRLQKLAAPITRRFDRGCNPARDIQTAIDLSGFSTLQLEHFTMPGLIPIPFIAGAATR
ncbi:class I SAM-dependent methyltransferase [Kribbella sp. NPDC051770]|uniref:class I SAM-dependent methyltransferase n=1 Tax=Kribbella sp. NPDC051770 TaxID=3155413 RepID=UPI0034202599